MEAGRSIEDLGDKSADEVCAWLLALDPRPMVVGLGEHGQFVALPAELQDHFPDATGWSWLDLIVPEDRHLVVGLWQQMGSAGRASGVVRLIEHPHPVTLQFLAAPSPGGANLVIVHDLPPELSRVEMVDPPTLPPRLTVVRKDDTGVIIEPDLAFSQMFGFADEEVIGTRMLDYVHPDEHYRVLKAWMDWHAAPEHDLRVRLRHRRKDDSWLWVEITQPKGARARRWRDGHRDARHLRGAGRPGSAPRP